MFVSVSTTKETEKERKKKGPVMQPALSCFILGRPFSNGQTSRTQPALLRFVYWLSKQRSTKFGLREMQDFTLHQPRPPKDASRSLIA